MWRGGKSWIKLTQDVETGLYKSSIAQRNVASQSVGIKIFCIYRFPVAGRTGSRTEERVNNKSRIFHYDGAEDTRWNMKASCLYERLALTALSCADYLLLLATRGLRTTNYSDFYVRLHNRTLIQKYRFSTNGTKLRLVRCNTNITLRRNWFTKKRYNCYVFRN